MKNFRPLLAIDATDHLDEIKYPKYASYKLDGIRCVFHPELGMVSRSLKPIQNKQLQEKFKDLIELSKTNNMIYDGEMYHHDLTFQQITALVMTQNFMDAKTCKKLNKEVSTLCNFYTTENSVGFNNPLQFHCFECYYYDDDNFTQRLIMLDSMEKMDNLVIVKQTIVNSKQEILDLFKTALDDGYEGLILRDPKSPYKFGRSTLKEEYCLKVKPFETFDAAIIEVQQSTEVDPNAEKKTNELGRSVTSRKKDDRILIEKASAFMVKYNEETVKVSLAMTDEEKEEVWQNKESYIGRMIEYKGMQIGAKNVPRHPVFVRFREDKNNGE